MVLIVVNIVGRAVGAEARAYINICQFLLAFQALLGIGSRYLWRAVNFAISPQKTAPPHGNPQEQDYPSLSAASTSFKDHVITDSTGHSVCVKVVRCLVLIFLVLTHATFLTLVLVQTNPTPFGMILFCCLGFYAQIVIALYFFNFVRWLLGKVATVVLKKPKLQISRRVTLLLAVGYGVTVSLVGLHTASLPPVLKYTDILLPKLPKSMEGYKIAQISDIHLGPTVGRDKLAQTVDIVNSIKPGIYLCIYIFMISLPLIHKNMILCLSLSSNVMFLNMF